MTGPDIHWMERSNEGLLVRTLPDVRKKLREMKMLPRDTDSWKQKAREVRAEVQRAIDTLQSIQLGLDEE